MDILSFVINMGSIVGMVIVATLVIASGKDRPKLFFAATIYTASIWLMIQYIVQFFSIGDGAGLKLIQFTSSISFAISFFFYCFSRSYTNKVIPIWLYISSLIFFAVELFLNMSGFMIQKAWGNSVAIVIDRATDLYQFYIIVTGIVFVVAFFELLKSTFTTKSQKNKTRNYLLIAGVLQAVIVLVVVSIFFQSSVLEAQIALPLSLLLMSIIVGFSIIRYQLFDIKFAVIRTLTYVLSLVVITVLYFFSAYGLSRYVFGEATDTFSRGPADIALVVFAALLFQPVKGFFDKVTNKIFFKDNYSSSDFFARLNRIITLTTDLRSLLVGSANEIAETLKIEQVSFVAVKQNDRIITAGTDKYNRIPKEDVDKIDEYIVSRGSATLVKSLLNEDKVEHEMARLMTSHKLEIIVPLLLSDKRIGYLCLGDKKISNFNRRDVGIMEAVADELTIAIQNALAIQEIREFNETLQQRVANATRELRKNNTMLRKLDKAKDEFVGMASHQLRTPLTSIKGYISMVLEGDAGKISEQQKHLLNEAFISSERMVHLIGDFLNVSRIQTGRFTIERTPVDLSKVVQQEVETLQSSAKARNLEYKYERPKDFPTLDLDESKLRQVIMNFADNALYYSRENSVIDVDLRVEGSDIVYTVKDTGIGVPKEEQDDLFTKFFRASNARIQRPDGTGVGLYLAKRIITGHGGKVIFKSVEGKGSTFGFRLPIK